jgi:hypothetical protein
MTKEQRIAILEESHHESCYIALKLEAENKKDLATRANDLANNIFELLCAEKATVSK